MYRIDNPGNERYVYAKYLADTQEEADAIYSQIADIHAGREYSFELYGGMPDSLDWYPVSKPELSTGPLLQNARAMYVTAYAAAPDSIDTYIDLALSSGANAMVVDIKDGALAYESELAKDLSPTSYQYSFLTEEQYRSKSYDCCTFDALSHYIIKIYVFHNLIKLNIKHYLCDVI